MRKILAAPPIAALLLFAAVPAVAATTIPAGSIITVRLNQAVSSKDTKSGQKVAAEVARDVTVDGKLVIPRGANATVYVAEAVPSGRLSTPAKLYLRLDSVSIHGKKEKISAHLAGMTGKSHKKRNEVGIGGGAAAGAVIGAIAGGGKGAAIGAAAGAGAGTAGAAATGKKDITFRAESTLSFRLRTALTVP
ncbi:MAG TPA: hypothetical protein VJN21_14465 [Candidatus Acidoferrales bacterium]|nr:hypothetical protein [Candidatus Acidoferrales bacterium]